MDRLPRFPAEQFSAGGSGQQDFTARRFAKILRGRISLESPRLIQLFRRSRASRNYIAGENDATARANLLSFSLSFPNSEEKVTEERDRDGLGLIICG